MGRTTFKKKITSPELIEQINPKNVKLINLFLKEKDRKFRFDQITELTDIQNETLDLELDKLELGDKKLWRKNIIVFESEPHLKLVEQKLEDKKNDIKKSIEINKLIVTSGMKDIKEILNVHEEHRDEIIDILRECKLFV